MAQNGQIVKGIRDSIAVQFSNNATTLAEFMITPRKPYTPLSIAARAAADAKAKATREARGTTSKKQKAQISGNVTGVTITPITTGTAAASTAPSSSAPSGTVTVGPVATGTAATSSGAPHS
jgi:hypothetical protein